MDRDAAKTLALVAGGGFLPFPLLGFGATLGISVWSFKNGDLISGVVLIPFSLFFLAFAIGTIATLISVSRQ